MPRPLELNRIVCIGLPRSTTREIRILCEPELRVEEGGRATMPDLSIRLADIEATQSDLVASMGLSSSAGQIVSVIPSVSIRSGTSHAGAIFDVTNPRSRLALLARLAHIACAAQGDTVRLTEVNLQFRCQLYRHCYQATTLLGSAIREKDLARRIGITPETLCRWFRKDGRVGPAEFLRWLSLHSLVGSLCNVSDSLGGAALRLGYSHADSARRSLARTTGLRPSDIRSAPVEAVGAFRSLMCKALGEQTIFDAGV